ncbi:MAG: efflux RND transporter permease subunit [Anaerolineae bacterium]|nr:efflux RND transporter permease subunit [Anaerolineae bacterium]
MKPFFDHITRLSIRFKWLTVALAVLLALGTYAALDLNIEMVPSIDIPSTFILVRSGRSTNGNLMLQAYTVPVENGAGNIDGVVNRESNTTNGLVFLEIRNEFGLDQDEIRDELQAVLDGLPLPTRTLLPPDGMTAQDMIGELPPDVVLYLHAYSLEEDLRFLAPLDQEV